MRSALQHLGALLLYLGLTVAETWPLASEPSHLYIENNDTFANTWALNEMARRLLEHPLHLFDANIFYPFSNTLAVLDHHFSSMPLAIPARAINRSPFFAANVVLLSTFVLSGFFAYLLVRRLSGSAGAALVAGGIFAFSNYRYTQLPHLHMLSTQWVPATLLALHAFLEAPGWKRLAWLTGAGALLALASWHMAIIGGLAVAWAAVWLLLCDGRAVGRRLAMLAFAGVLVLITLLPFIKAYAQTSSWQMQGDENAQVRGLSRNAMSIEGLFTPGLLARQRYLPSRSISDEARLFPGAAPLALAVWGAWSVLPRRRRSGRWSEAVGLFLWTSLFLVGAAIATTWWGAGAEVLADLRFFAPFVLASLALLLVGIERARISRGRSLELIGLTYLAMTLFGIGLALGPRVYLFGSDLGAGIFYAHLLPGTFRAPARFSLVMVMGLTVLAGFGTADLLKRLPSVPARTAGVLVILIAVTLDLWPARINLTRAPEGPAAVYRWLAEHPEPGAIIEYPIVQGNWAVLNGFLHNRRLVNGTGAIEPPASRLLNDRAAFTPAGLAVLWEHLHPRFVVLRSAAYSPEKRQQVLTLIAQREDALRLRAQFGSDYVFELFDRGFGPVLFRRWPRQALERRQRIAWVGAVEGAPDHAEPVLEVAFNDRIVSRVVGAAATVAQERFVALDGAPLAAGINTMEIRATYRLNRKSPVSAPQVADIPADITVLSAADRAVVEVNGRAFPVDKGYLVVTLDPRTGDVAHAEGFNTSWFEEASEGLAAFVQALPPGTPVILASEFDVSRRLTDSAVRAFRALGLTADPRGHFGWAHAAIGIKGAKPGEGLEAFEAQTANVALGSPARPTVRLSSLGVY